MNDEVKQPGDEPEDNPESASGVDQAPADENDAEPEVYPGEGSAGLAATAGESEILKPDAADEETDEERQEREEAAGESEILKPDAAAEETDEERQEREEAAKAREVEKAERQKRQAEADKNLAEAVDKLPMPSVGRIVHYFDGPQYGAQAAIVTAVQDKTSVSLRIISSGAPEYDQHKAFVLHEVVADGAFWCWPPKV